MKDTWNNRQNVCILTKSAKIFIALVFLYLALVGLADNSTSRIGPAGQALTGKRAYTVPNSQMVWGDTTNLRFWVPLNIVASTLKVGIRSKNGVIELSGNPPELVGPVSVYVKNVYGRPVWEIKARTNGPPMKESEFIRFLFLPPESERLAVRLTDFNGVPVPKTKAGNELVSPKLGGKDWKHWEKDGRQGFDLLSHQDFELYPLDPTKYFSLKTPGSYKLTLIQHLYVIGTNNLLKVISLPPVTVDVKVEEGANR